MSDATVPSKLTSGLTQHTYMGVVFFYSHGTHALHVRVRSSSRSLAWVIWHFPFFHRYQITILTCHNYYFLHPIVPISSLSFFTRSLHDLQSLHHYRRHHFSSHCAPPPLPSHSSKQTKEAKVISVTPLHHNLHYTPPDNCRSRDPYLSLLYHIIHLVGL